MYSFFDALNFVNLNNIPILSLGVENLMTPKETRDESEKLKDQLVSVEFTYYPKPLDPNQLEPFKLVLLEITCPLQPGNPQTHFSNFPVLVSSHALHTLNILGLALILVPYPIIPLDNDQIVPEEILKEMSYPKTFDMEPNPLVSLEITYPTQPVDPQTQAYTLTVHVPAKALQVINTFSLAFILIDPNQDAWITYPEPLYHDMNQFVPVEFTYPIPLDCNPNQLVPMEMAYPPPLINDPNHLVPAEITYPTLLDYNPSHPVPMEMACPCPPNLDHDPNQLVPAEITYPTPLNDDSNQLVPIEMACPCPTSLDHDPNQLMPLEITYPTPLNDDPNQLGPMEMACPCPTSLNHDPNQLVPWDITYPEPLDFGPIELVPLKIANPTPLYDDPNQLVPVEITYPTSLDYDPNLILPLEITYSPHIHTFNVHVPAHALETIKLFLISGLISDKKTIKNLLAIPQDVAERQFQSVIDIWIKQISKHSISEWEQYKMHSGPLKTLVKEPLEPSEPSESSEQSEPLEPLEPSEPLKPSGPLEPSEPLESSEASESSEPQSNPRYIFLALPSQDFFTYVICNEINFFLYVYMF